RYAATELASGVFMSRGDGTFRFERLPRLAQIAPIFGMVAGDFDGDGLLDLYAVQNSHAPMPIVGRFDGGLSVWLRGDGRGGFAVAPFAESGLVVPGDAKALAACDLDDDGWGDFVVTRNSGATLVFQNRGVAGRRALRVALRGGRGNPHAIGARITVELFDGRTQALEVQAGAGYYSQSSAAGFFGYEEKRGPRAVRINWPSGKETQHEVTAGAARLTLTERE
ncbi:MAG TPA: CRTAC1 family protein, partial [Opitutus sp.]|nr:CRTAC1 family protein [Opitutus sp.]